MMEKQEQSRQNLSGKVDKEDEKGSGSGEGGSTLDKILASSPKITARYEQILATVKAKAEIIIRPVEQ